MARYSGSSWRSYRPSAGAAGALPGPPANAARIGTSAPCRILGLDPGSLRTGYGLIDCTATGERHVANGCINVRGEDFLVRLRRIFEAIAILIDEHRPDEIAIERVFVHRNVDSALKLGQARGAAICAAVALGASAYEYAPRAIKLAVSGFGAADKLQVARMVTALLSLESRPVADAADALAVALCHAQSRRLEALRAASQAPRASARRGSRGGARSGVRP
ncbi:MAG TPA: crossover junction endodeoxyribonuclease RuvC [Steroidobacteraceae bacterium]|jgi:crossover junction endodeoxyribonuclease RuvC|nr:crossover junction endodeoxyribonuclease RuvC [Steroidobacteraceae bacterium]